MKKPLIPVAVMLLAGLSRAGWHFWPAAEPEFVLQASGTLESTPIELASRLGGRVTEVMATEGELLKPGQVLLRLDARELQAQYQQVQAQQQAASAQLRLLQAGSRPEDLQSAEAAWRAAELRVSELHNGSRQAEKERAQAEVQARQSQLELAEKDYARMADLVSAEAQPQQKLDQARQLLQTARSGLTQAQKNQQLVQEGARQEELAIAQQQALQQKSLLQKLQRGVRPQEIEAAQAHLQQAKAQAEQLRIRLQEASVTAPCACQLSVLGVEKGEVVGAGAAVVTLLDPQDLWVKVYLSPLELKHVRLQQPVSLQLDAWPDQRFAGKVVYVSSQAEFTPRNIQTREERIHQVFAVKVKLLPLKGHQAKSEQAAQQGPGLFAGLPVDVIWEHS